VVSLIVHSVPQDMVYCAFMFYIFCISQLHLSVPLQGQIIFPMLKSLVLEVYLSQIFIPLRVLSSSQQCVCFPVLLIKVLRDHLATSSFIHHTGNEAKISPLVSIIVVVLQYGVHLFTCVQLVKIQPPVKPCQFW